MTLYFGNLILKHTALHYVCVRKELSGSADLNTNHQDLHPSIDR